MSKIYDKCVEADFKRILNRKGYAYFTNGAYNLNIIGVRCTSNKDSNEFNDIIVVDYKNSDLEYCRAVFPATTDPGFKSRTDVQNSKGCAILVPGQYRGCWTIGLHKGKYEALVQRKPVKVYRDNNKDKIIDLNPSNIDEGVFGINIHKAGDDSTYVDGWSAGCQVFKRSKNFDTFMVLCNNQVKSGMGKTFTYTLLTEDDLR